MSPEADRWDGQLAELARPAPLLQSWGWGEVQSGAGWRVERVSLPGAAFASVQVRSVGPALDAYVPRGPVPATAASVSALIGWARVQNVARLVVEPEASTALDGDLAALALTRVTAVQPRHTRLLELTAPDDMMRTFQHGRRYNIRAGLRRGVTVTEGKDAGELTRQTAAVERRESIDLPNESYYQLLLNRLPWCRTYVARAAGDGPALAAVLVARHQGRAYSLYAGRSGVHNELMGSDVAWWSAISAAAAAGCADFDLWGVPPPESGPDHPWRGLGSFKAEFGGRLVEYTGTWEIVLSSAGAGLVEAERRLRTAARRIKKYIS